MLRVYIAIIVMLFVCPRPVGDNNVYAQRSTSSDDLSLFVDSAKWYNPPFFLNYECNDSDTKQLCDSQNDKKDEKDHTKQTDYPFVFSMWVPAVLQFIAVLIAIRSLCINKKQMKESNAQSIKAYKAFIQKSERQFQTQQQTLKAERQTINTIKEQASHIENKNHQIKVYDCFSECYSLLKAAIVFVGNHFWDILRRKGEYDYFQKNIVLPLVKSANTLQLLNHTDNDTSFDGALESCIQLQDFKVRNLSDMDFLVEKLERILKGFEAQKTILKGQK